MKKTHHVLKCWPDEFKAIHEKRKRFEWRKNDRDFKEGDSLEFKEWNPQTEKYTTRFMLFTVGYLLKDKFGIPPGYCVFNLDVWYPIKP